MSETGTFSSKESVKISAAHGFAERTESSAKGLRALVKSYLKIRKFMPLSLFDVLSAVSALGVLAATVVWALI